MDDRDVLGFIIISATIVFLYARGMEVLGNHCMVCQSHHD